MEMSLMELYQSMGWFAKGIVYTLAGHVCLLVHGAHLEVVELRKAQMETIKFAPEFSQFLEEDNLQRGDPLAEELQEVACRARARWRARRSAARSSPDGSVTVVGHQLGGARG